LGFPCHVRITPDSDRTADIAAGPVREAAALNDAHEALDRSEFVQSYYSILWSSLVREGIFIESSE
jgi:hypothetical protein